MMAYSCLPSANRQQSSDEWHGSIGGGSCSDSEDPSIYSNGAECPRRSNPSEDCRCQSRNEQSACQSGKDKTRLDASKTQDYIRTHGR